MSRIFTVAVFLLALFCAAAWASEDVKPSPALLANISHLEIHRGYSGYVARVDDPDKVKQIVDEIRGLRKETWRPFIGKPGACVMRVTLFNHEGKVLSLSVGRKSILEMPLTKEQGRLYKSVEPKDVPHLRELLIEIGLPERCQW
jgi:hypothetical protein